MKAKLARNATKKQNSGSRPVCTICPVNQPDTALPAKPHPSDLLRTWPGQTRAGRIDRMALQLAPEEPEAGPWQVAALTAVMTTLMRNGPREPVASRPVVIA